MTEQQTVAWRWKERLLGSRFKEEVWRVTNSEDTADNLREAGIKLEPLYASPAPTLGVEGVARIIDPVAWRRFDRNPHYADHVPHETQIEWHVPLQDSLAKARAIIAAMEKNDGKPVPR